MYLLEGLLQRKRICAAGVTRLLLISILPEMTPATGFAHSCMQRHNNGAKSLSCSWHQSVPFFGTQEPPWQADGGSSPMANSNCAKIFTTLSLDWWRGHMERQKTPFWSPPPTLLSPNSVLLWVEHTTGLLRVLFPPPPFPLKSHYAKRWQILCRLLQGSTPPPSNSDVWEKERKKICSKVFFLKEALWSMVRIGELQLTLVSVKQETRNRNTPPRSNNQRDKWHGHKLRTVVVVVVVVI